jgi:lysophospholipase L1-like esterase
LKIQPKSKLLMIGDSITDANRAKPVGEGLFEALGQGYVSLVDALLNAVYPKHQIRVVNMGLSGNTIRDLDKRWQTDVIDLKPDWVSIMIGVNDVWRQYDLPRQPETHVYAEEYEKTLDDLVSKTKPLVKGMILMTPFYIESNPKDAMRATMDQYGAIVKRMAEKHDTIFVDVQAALNEVLKSNYAATIAWDRVHPGRTGHMVMALAFLKAVGFEMH